MTYTIACCNLFLASNSFPKANDRNSEFSLPIDHGELVAFFISVTKFFTEAIYGTKGLFRLKDWMHSPSLLAGLVTLTVMAVV